MLLRNYFRANATHGYLPYDHFFPSIKFSVTMNQ